MGNDSSKLINQFVDKNVTGAISTLLESDNIKQVNKSADVIAKGFGSATGLFEKEAAGFEEKLISSFQKNLSLLIQKTWVEESDADLKEQVLYQLGDYCKAISKGKWTNAYAELLKIIGDVVYLMFGTQTKSEDFLEYALRIDPEFGVFWLYVKKLPEEIKFEVEKARVIMLLGMYFLANY